jgi:hypothetical protein
MKHLRLVKVVCQAHFVSDDGEALEEITTDPVHVKASDWPDFATGSFVSASELLEQQLNVTEPV